MHTIQTNKNSTLYQSHPRLILPLTFEQKLDLHDNRFDNLSVEAIAAALQDGGGMPCLDELYLGFNTFADESLPYVAFFRVYMYT